MLISCYSAQGFLTFMSGYTVFLGPFAGIMVTDVRFHSTLVGFAYTTIDLHWP